MIAIALLQVAVGHKDGILHLLLLLLDFLEELWIEHFECGRTVLLVVVGVHGRARSLHLQLEAYGRLGRACCRGATTRASIVTRFSRS